METSPFFQGESMKQKIEIILEIEDDKGKIKLLHNGKEIPKLFGYNFNYNSRTGEIGFLGKRLSTDEYGQYFVDEKGETATEEIDLMSYFSDKYQVREMITETKKETEWALKNVRDTTVFNARKMIENRLAN